MNYSINSKGSSTALRKVVEFQVLHRPSLVRHRTATYIFVGCYMCLAAFTVGQRRSSPSCSSTFFHCVSLSVDYLCRSQQRYWSLSLRRLLPLSSWLYWMTTNQESRQAGSNWKLHVQPSCTGCRQVLASHVSRQQRPFHSRFGHQQQQSWQKIDAIHPCFHIYIYIICIYTY